MLTQALDITTDNLASDALILVQMIKPMTTALTVDKLVYRPNRIELTFRERNAIILHYPWNEENALHTISAIVDHLDIPFAPKDALLLAATLAGADAEAQFSNGENPALEFKPEKSDEPKKSRAKTKV